MIRYMDKHNKNTSHDFKGLDDWFPAFKGGAQTDSAGVTKVWSDAELDEIVANTQKKIEDNGLYAGAPFVIGHPKTDDPAYGWTEQIKRVGDTIYTKGTKIVEEFAKGVKDGLWPNRSIRIGKDAGGFYLRHIGFLGAVPPAIEGLGSVYSDAEGEFYDFAVDSYTPSVMARMLRRMREFIVDKFGTDAADKVIPDYEIESLSEHANSLRAEDNPQPTSFSKPEPSTGDEPMSEFTQADIDAAKAQAAKEAREQAEADFAEKQKTADQKLTDERNKRLSAEFSAAITAMIDKGTLTPAQAEGMSEFMLQLSDTDEAQFEFNAGEGDKKETLKKSPLAWFREFTQSIGKQVDTDESDAGDDIDTGSHHYAAPRDSHVDADRLALHNKALDYQKQHGGEYVDAVRAVEKQES